MDIKDFLASGVAPDAPDPNFINYQALYQLGINFTPDSADDSDKLRILVCIPNFGGCAYYRSLMPFGKMAEVFPHRVAVRFDDNALGANPTNGRWLPNWKFTNLKWADVVVVNNISNFGGAYTARLVGKAKEFGKFVHYDTDDLLTNLYDEHQLKEVYDKGLSDTTKFIYYHSDLVSVTQKKFANRISQYCNSYLTVLKNAIDYNLECWQLPRYDVRGMCRIGWAGGIHHNPDVKIVAGVPAIVNQKVGLERVKWNFYGHPPPPSSPEKKDEWQQQVWKHYKRELLKGVKGKNWDIHQALPPNHYGVIYASMDVSIAPLKMNEFNDSKSDVKIAECGRYAVPLVASNVGCYDEVIVNGKNGYLIDPDAPKKEWIRILTKLVKDEKHRKELGMNLKAETDRLYDMNRNVIDRLNLYYDCFKMAGYDPRGLRHGEKEKPKV